MLKKSMLILSAILLAGALPLQAQTKLAINENEMLDLVLSKNDFNRLFVEGDKVAALRFPEGYLSVENDADGSVYLDVKDDRVFTLFVTTQKGRHFSARIKTDDVAGQTIGFVQSQQALKASKTVGRDVARNKYQAEMKALVLSTEREEQKAGYHGQKLRQKPVNITTSLHAQLIYTLSNAQKMGQKFKLINQGKQPVIFKDRWFKDKDTKALLVKERTIYPGTSITVVRVEEGVQHG